ncbi:phosphoadenylyl-sulfate reductase [Bacillus carboniphilus]|uniref:Adenosine 5'-phosphosulfate reductase n=1 Tax=Bacillus carboniphilus TaxID=86663 RepID=A0ABY9JW11_9BACI|nr:phosphoadenylyl-sulfate reductase [Bacillus carboniphilus]WLR43594.1 phosphoadenylyl-sulfate reductase [Bacillus carboniphilus]
MLTYEDEIGELTFDKKDETKGALQVLNWAFETYDKDAIVYACSFGIEGIVLIDLLTKVESSATVVFLNTHLHFQETYDVINSVKEKYPYLVIKLIEPELSVEEQANQYGEKLWERNPSLCCHLRKVDPLRKTLQNKYAWISGLRKEQSLTREHIQFINQDHQFKKIKICPIAHWTWKEIWRYAHNNHLPYNKLHDQGYPSIGCFPCTSPTCQEEDLRSGRWKGKDKLECGLHENVRRS